MDRKNVFRLMALSVLFLAMFGAFAFAEETGAASAGEESSDGRIVRTTAAAAVTARPGLAAAKDAAANRDAAQKLVEKQRAALNARLKNNSAKPVVAARIANKQIVSTRATNKCFALGNQSLRECVKNLGVGLGSGDLDKKCDEFEGEKREVCLKHLSRFSESCSDLSDDQSRAYCLKAIDIPLKNCRDAVNDNKTRCLNALENIKCDDFRNVSERVLCLKYGRGFKKVAEDRLDKLKDVRQRIKDGELEIGAIKRKYPDLRKLAGEDKRKFAGAVLERLHNEFNQRIRALDSLETKAESNETLALIGEMRDYLNSQAAAFKATNSTEEKKAIINATNDRWREFRQKITKLLLQDKIDDAVARASGALDRLDVTIANLAAKGHDTAKLQALSAAARAKLDNVTVEGITLAQARWRLAHVHRWFAAVKTAILRTLNNKPFDMPRESEEPSAKQLEEHPEEIEQEEQED